MERHHSTGRNGRSDPLRGCTDIPYFLQRILRPDEIVYCRLHQHPAIHVAARFAAKEAVMKALNTANRGIGFRDIEVLGEPDGKPFITLYGTARQLAQKLGINGLTVSLSHSRENAVAVVLSESSK